MTIHAIDRCPRCGSGLVKRSHEQNSKLHALLHDISEQKMWAGAYRSVEEWKRLMVAAFERANKNPPLILPAIDGQGIDMIYTRTSRMSKEEMSELIEFATQWAIDNDIRLQEAA